MRLKARRIDFILFIFGVFKTKKAGKLPHPPTSKPVLTNSQKTTVVMNHLGTQA